MKLMDNQYKFVEKLIKNKPFEIYSLEGKTYFDCSITVKCMECNEMMECEKLFEDDLPFLTLENAKIIKEQYPEYFI